jgi:hypothetical protein
MNPVRLTCLTQQMGEFFHHRSLVALRLMSAIPCPTRSRRVAINWIDHDRCPAPNSGLVRHFVPPYTFDWCVAASIQIMHNLIDDTGAGTWADRVQQGELWEMARARSSNSFNGANPLGWAKVLTKVGMGPYAVVSIADYEEALQTAARAIADTDRPVGLVNWRGRHVWVMSGFESLGDPDQFPEFSVTGIRVQDPLYPYGSEQWGPSPAPNTVLTPEQLATQFVVREPRRWSSDLPTGYLLVLPVAEV